MLWPPLAMLLAFGALNAVIWLLLPQPPYFDPCSDDFAPPHYTAKLHEFQRPAYALIGLCGVAIATWVVRSSWASRGDRPGIPTIVATAALAVGALAALAWPPAAVVWVLPALLGIVTRFGSLGLVLIWGLALAAGPPRPRGSRRYSRVTAWLLLGLGLPAIGLLVWLAPPGFNGGPCFD